MRLRFLAVLLCMPFLLYAQQQVVMHITDARTGEVVPLVTISTTITYLATSDSLGNASINLVDGKNGVILTMAGYKRLDTTITVPTTATINIALATESNELEEVTIVATTRNGQAMESSPLKVEVLGKEELGEEAGIKPGNIASILGDVSGVQIQQSSATSGNSNVRIQGLDGRYTQILRDGMPLYDGFSGGFGILTVPPLDLQQIELVKGAASTLYGGGAIAGLVNLVSKRPAYKQEADVLVNYTTLKEFNTNAYIAKRNKHFGYNLFAGYTNQQAVDVNKDALSDVPDISSILIHPKVFFYPSDKTVISIGYSGAFDQRKGGDMQVLNDKADLNHQYFEKNNSQRHTGEYLFEKYLHGNAKLTVKGNLSNFDLTTTTNYSNVQGTQLSYYNEASIYLPLGKSDLVAGINIVGDDYNNQLPDTTQLKTFSNLTTGAFGQFSWHIKDNTIIEAGLRFDYHNTYGLYALPRLAIFHRFDEHWATRAGFGMGYKTPNPLVQQNIEYNVYNLLPLNASVKPEISYGYNAEVNYKTELGKNNSLFINQAFFLTQITDPILFQTNAAGKTSLINTNKPLSSKGFDTYIKLQLHSWELYFGYTFTSAKRTYYADSSYLPLTPKNKFAFVVAKEFGEHWRAGLEGSYNGSQYRYDGTLTPGYFFAALMIQRNFGKHFSVVLNGENLLDYRMSNVETLYTGSILNPNFKPLWAPIDGRVINLSLRYKL
jgi:outer membrane receptor for ferrienterochelin and colicins